MSFNKIWICDDNETLRDQWEGELAGLGISNVEHVSQNILGDAVRQLEARRVAAVKGHDPVDEAYLDGVNVLIVDYDLLDLDERSYLTGENVAYLARTFSRCGFILAMNQYGRNSFDLTMKGHVESFADLNIGSEQLNNPNLWGTSVEGFNPWHWPVIENWLTAQQQRVEQIREHLDSPVFGFLEFDSEMVDMMPLSILEMINPSGEEKNSSAITFRDVILNSPLGIREKKDSAISDDQLVLIAAARISKWLERIVLPCMEYLIDAPHLALRFPSLCGGAEGIAGKCGQDLKVNPIDIDSSIEEFSFEKADWIGRPVWWINRLKEHEGLPEVSSPWDTVFPDDVFCEDVSTICTREASRSFVAELPTAAPQRWVKRIDGVVYNPSVRFSL